MNGVLTDEVLRHLLQTDAERAAACYARWMGGADAAEVRARLNRRAGEEQRTGELLIAAA